MVPVNQSPRKELLLGTFVFYFFVHRLVWGGQLMTTFNGKMLSLFGPSEAVVDGDCSTEKLLLRPPLYRGECGMWPAVEKKRRVRLTIESHTDGGT